jgi:hypothetical protein
MHNKMGSSLDASHSTSSWVLFAMYCAGFNTASARGSALAVVNAIRRSPFDQSCDGVRTGAASNHEPTRIRKVSIVGWDFGNPWHKIVTLAREQ